MTGRVRYLFSGHAITWSTVRLRSCLHSWGCGLNEVPWTFDSGDFGPYWHGILTCCRSQAAHPWCQSSSWGNWKVLHWGETSELGRNPLSCSGFEMIQALWDDMLSRLVQETGKAAPAGERLPFKTPHSLKFIMQLLLLYLKLECRPIPAHLIKYQKGDRRYRCEVQWLCFAERQIPMSESSSRPSR